VLENRVLRRISVQYLRERKKQMDEENCITDS
jgi:hypothetical protein